MEKAAYNQPESVIDSHEDCAEFWSLSWLANHHEYDWPVCTVILTYLPASKHNYNNNKSKVGDFTNNTPINPTRTFHSLC